MQLPYFGASPLIWKPTKLSRPNCIYEPFQKFNTYQNFQRKNAGLWLQTRIEPKIDCGPFQTRGLVSVSYVLCVRVTPTEHFAETLTCVWFLRERIRWQGNISCSSCSPMTSNGFRPLLNCFPDSVESAAVGLSWVNHLSDNSFWWSIYVPCKNTAKPNHNAHSFLPPPPPQRSQDSPQTSLITHRARVLKSTLKYSNW